MFMELVLYIYIFYYYPHHMNMIIDKFAAKVGEPWILQTNLTEYFVLQKYNVTG